eukprot:1101323-Rhodomonas_salina.2
MSAVDANSTETLRRRIRPCGERRSSSFLPVAASAGLSMWIGRRRTSNVASMTAREVSVGWLMVCQASNWNLLTLLSDC